MLAFTCIILTEGAVIALQTIKLIQGSHEHHIAVLDLTLRSIVVIIDAYVLRLFIRYMLFF